MSNKFKSVWHVTVLFLSNTPIQTLSGSYGAEDDLTVVVVVTADDDEDGIGDDSELDDAAERSDFSLSTLPANVFNNYNSHPSIHPRAISNSSTSNGVTLTSKMNQPRLVPEWRTSSVGNNGTNSPNVNTYSLSGVLHFKHNATMQCVLLIV